MTNVLTNAPANSLRQRMIEDMNMRRFARKTQFDYVRHVVRFATYLGRTPDTATVEDLRQFQVEQREARLGIPTFNSIVAALRFFFRVRPKHWKALPAKAIMRRLMPTAKTTLLSASTDGATTLNITEAQKGLAL